MFKIVCNVQTCLLEIFGRHPVVGNVTAAYVLNIGNGVNNGEFQGGRGISHIYGGLAKLCNSG